METDKILITWEENMREISLIKEENMNLEHFVISNQPLETFTQITSRSRTVWIFLIHNNNHVVIKLIRELRRDVWSIRVRNIRYVGGTKTNTLIQKFGKSDAVDVGTIRNVTSNEFQIEFSHEPGCILYITQL